MQAVQSTNQAIQEQSTPAAKQTEILEEGEKQDSERRQREFEGRPAALVQRLSGKPATSAPDARESNPPARRADLKTAPQVPGPETPQQSRDTPAPSDATLFPERELEAPLTAPVLNPHGSVIKPNIVTLRSRQASNEAEGVLERAQRQESELRHLIEEVNVLVRTTGQMIESNAVRQQLPALPATPAPNALDHQMPPPSHAGAKDTYIADPSLAGFQRRWKAFATSWTSFGPQALQEVQNARENLGAPPSADLRRYGMQEHIVKALNSVEDMKSRLSALEDRLATGGGLQTNISSLQHLDRVRGLKSLLRQVDHDLSELLSDSHSAFDRHDARNRKTAA